METTDDNMEANLVESDENRDDELDEWVILEATWGETLPSKMRPLRWLTGKQLWEGKYHGRGTRYYITRCLSHYLYFGDPASNIEPLGCEEQREILLQRWFEQSDLFRDLPPLTTDELRGKRLWRPESQRSNASSRKGGCPQRRP